MLKSTIQKFCIAFLATIVLAIPFTAFTRLVLDKPLLGLAVIGCFAAIAWMTRISYRLGMKLHQDR